VQQRYEVSIKPFFAKRDFADNNKQVAAELTVKNRIAAGIYQISYTLQ